MHSGSVLCRRRSIEPGYGLDAASRTALAPHACEELCDDKVIPMSPSSELRAGAGRSVAASLGLPAFSTSERQHKFGSRPMEDSWCVAPGASSSFQPHALLTQAAGSPLDGSGIAVALPRPPRSIEPLAADAACLVGVASKAPQIISGKDEMPSQRVLVASQELPEIPPHITLMWPQKVIEEGIRAQLPHEWLKQVQLPYVEDLLADPIFTSYAEWWSAFGADPHAATPPDWVSLQQKARIHASQGVQHKAHTAKDALPSLIAPDTSKDMHFKSASELCMPWHLGACVDYDIKYAAAQTIKNMGSLRAYRQDCRRAFTALAHRCESFTAALCKQQPVTVHRVAGGVHLGLLAVLAVVIKWPDLQIAKRIVTGLSVIGE